MPTTRSLRGPGYPAMSLPDAIVKIEAIYRKERIHPVHRDVLVKHIGYGTWNGASMPVVNTLIRYGLLEQAGSNKEQYRISDDGIAILSNYPERPKIIQKLAFMPSPFGELHQYYGNALPSDQNIRMYLVKKGYNDKHIDGIIRAYRDTIEFVNVETEGSITESLEEEEVPKQMQTPKMKETPPSPDNDMKRGSDKSSLLEKEVSKKVWSLDLSEDCFIEMVLTGHVTKEALDNLKEFVDVVRKAAPSASPPKPETDHHEPESVS